MDIDQTDTLQYRSARDEKDERHICPLQLPVIRRAIELWTNENDIVLSPFGGIGSEPVTAIEMGRRAIAIELKDSYYKQMKANCDQAIKTKTSDLFFEEVI
jgi:DNA modification methylase